MIEKHTCKRGAKKHYYLGVGKDGKSYYLMAPVEFAGMWLVGLVGIRNDYDDFEFVDDFTSLYSDVPELDELFSDFFAETPICAEEANHLCKLMAAIRYANQYLWALSYGRHQPEAVWQTIGNPAEEERIRTVVIPAIAKEIDKILAGKIQ